THARTFCNGMAGARGIKVTIGWCMRRTEHTFGI
ncbi:MAG: hypothetical protein ACI9FD_000506, partial [Gammaproteobacteria bacterium]